MSPVILAVITAFSMATGQILFKMGSDSWTGETLQGWIISFLKNPYLVIAVFMYAVTILIWIYVLKHLPLSVAYPITALSYVIVPIASYFIFQEKLSFQVAVGSLAIIFGIAIIHFKAA